MKCLMAALVTLLVCLIFETNLFASGSVVGAKPNPLRRPGGCYEDNTGHLKYGEHLAIPGKCVKASCESDGSTSYASCGVITIQGHGCHLSEVDLAKPYPDCCSRPICEASHKATLKGVL